MFLVAKDIVSGYGKMEILHGISIHLDELKTVALIGPNGCGKSTLLKTIFGFIKPSQGSITFNDEDITGCNPGQLIRKGISFVPQGRTVFPYLTVLENIKMGAYIVKEKEQVDKAIRKGFEKFPQLNKKRNQMAGSLSGGEQRMLDLARAWVLNPKVMLLDEPSLGLAPIIMDFVYDEIKKLRDEGVTLLIAEQNVRKVLTIVDYTFVLDQGRNAYEGTPQDLLSSDKLKEVYLGGRAT